MSRFTSDDIETVDKSNYRAHLTFDPEPPNPRDDAADNDDTVMVCIHDNYTLGDDKKRWECPEKTSGCCSTFGETFETWAKNPAGYGDWESDYEEWDRQYGWDYERRKKGEVVEGDIPEPPVIKEDKPAFWLVLYLYDHSGLSMSGNRVPRRSRDWDTSCVGFIYMTWEMAIKNGLNPESAEGVEHIYKWLEGEVKQYDTYLTGMVYAWYIEKVSTCDHGHEHTKTVESCGGYFEEEDAKSEMISTLDWLVTQDEEPGPKTAA
jgi:hypothetical protein